MPDKEPLMEREETTIDPEDEDMPQLTELSPRQTSQYVGWRNIEYDDGSRQAPRLPSPTAWDNVKYHKAPASSHWTPPPAGSVPYWQPSYLYDEEQERNEKQQQRAAMIDLSKKLEQPSFTSKYGNKAKVCEQHTAVPSNTPIHRESPAGSDAERAIQYLEEHVKYADPQLADSNRVIPQFEDNKEDITVVKMDDGVTAVIGKAHFNNDGTTVIDEHNHALQQEIFDRLPLSGVPKKDRNGKVIHQRREFFDWLKAEHDGKLREATKHDGDQEELQPGDAVRRPEGDVPGSVNGGP